MRRWFLHLMFELGSGKAVANARREYDETARTLAGISALEARMAALHAAQRRIAA
jgi:hypothetical protein